MVQPLMAEDPPRLGPFELTGRLGEGGQGVVYLGRGPQGEQVAVKLLHHGLTADPEARARFLREVSVAQRVARFCTAPVLHADLAGSRPYIVSEYVPGPSLRQLVDAEGPRRGGALERLAVSTATALSAIHRAGVLHRDFKPANVLMGPEGPVVIDFGIARALDSPGMTATGTAMGTPSYLAPEQLGGGEVTPAADVFAWGVTMVFAATGTPAFGQDSIPVVMNRVLTAEPDLGPMDPGPLRDLVAACLSKDPAARPSAEELVRHLTEGTAPAPRTPRPPHAAPAPRIPHPVPAGRGPVRPARRPVGLLLAGVATVAALGVATGTVVVLQDGETAASTRAAGPSASSAQGQEPAAGPGTRPAGGEPPASGEPPAADGPDASGGAQPTPARTRRASSSEPRVPSGNPADAGRDTSRSRPAEDRTPRPTRKAASAPRDGFLEPETGSPRPSPGAGRSSAPATAAPRSGSEPTVRTSSKPTPKPTPRPTLNPYTAAQACGPGFKQIGSHALGSRAMIHLFYNATSKQNCVVTRSRYYHPGKVRMNAILQVKGGASASDPGSFTSYAGPVKLSAAKKCVIWGGSYGSLSWKSGWSHCG
ncbi:serine/threonine protein kinase [Planomonospora corallina]|uniref:Serine/threonine protein kinase n=1 Tax=Planomonospora corallina TaxID=1806052 RepID=A0ABV8HYA2_9ACTN